MKKIIVSTFLLASLVACYKDDAILEEIVQEPLTKSKDYLSGDEHVKMKRHKITPERAMLIAEDAKDFFTDERAQVKTRSATVPLLPVAITSHPKTRSAGGADTLMYVVNFSNNGGYVFVSNDDRDGEILMYSGGGSFQMQDTTDNPGLKLHVELMLGYQKHKLSEMRAAEARGEEYMGSMTTETLDMDFAPNDVMPVGMASGMPGGLPGHTCNVTGQPGLPGSTITRKDICAPSKYISKDWEGNSNAIKLAQNKYRNQKCFGVPVLPPEVHFTKAGPGGQGHIDSQCASYPYCYPHVENYSGYYYSYGCKMSMHLKTLRDTLYEYVAPLLTTRWNQHEPLKHYDYVAGCGPIAIVQILAYHKMPKTYGSREYGGVLETKLDFLREYVTNEDLAKSPYLTYAQKLVNEIGERLNVTYSDGGSGVVSLVINTKKIRETFDQFGYSATKEDVLSYKNGDNYHRIFQSIWGRRPVLIYGYPQGALGPRLRDGHIWVLDGYKKKTDRAYCADYYFDEKGNFNAENRYFVLSNEKEFIHANMGWTKAEDNDVWVDMGAYVFGGTDFSGKIFFIADIQPKV